MPIFSSKSKEGKRSVNFIAGERIGHIAKNIPINATLEDERIVIKPRLSKNAEVILAYSKITDVAMLSEEEISTQSKSVGGRALVGGLLLGPVGAIVGGMSGIGEKKKTQQKYYIIINYTSNQAEKEAVVFEIVGASIGANKFFKELQEKCCIDRKSPNQEGPLEL